MNISKYSVAICAALLAGSLMAQAGDSTDCKKSGSPEKIEGRITNVDMNEGKITVKSDNGKTHVFNASQATLKNYKVGDNLKMALRCK